MSAEGRWLFDPLARGMGSFTRWVVGSGDVSAMYMSPNVWSVRAEDVSPKKVSPHSEIQIGHVSGNCNPELPSQMTSGRGVRTSG